jgi:hypothetical protein
LGRDLLKLREVANGSVQGAIATHDSKQIADDARGKLCVAITAACAAAVLFWTGRSGSAVATALLAALIAAVWGSQAIFLFLKARRLAQRAPGVTPE